MAELQDTISKLNNFRTRAESRRQLISMGSDTAGAALLEFATASNISDNVGWAVATIVNEWKWKEAKDYLINVLAGECLYSFDVMDALNAITDDDFANDRDAWLTKYVEGYVAPTAANLVEMTNWESLIFVLDNKVRYSEFVDNIGRLSLVTPGERKHQVVVMPEGEPWSEITLYTVCGIIGPDKLEATKSYGESLTDFELKIEEEVGQFTVSLSKKYNFVLFDVDDMAEQVNRIAIEGDNLEKQLTGQDII